MDFGYKPPDVISLATVSLQWLHDNQLNGLVKVESFVERGCQADVVACIYPIVCVIACSDVVAVDCFYVRLHEFYLTHGRQPCLLAWQKP